jgi:hypothetical protein
MALSDRLLQNTPTPLPGNLNRTEMDTIKGIPRSVFDKLSQEDKERILGLGNIREPIGNLNRTEIDTIKGIPKSIFNTLSPEEQSRVLGGNLNRTEMDQLQGSELGMGMSSEFRELINRIIAMGVPKEEVLRIIQSRMDAMTTSPGNLNRTEMEMLNNSAPINRFNTGGIVSLKRLTRPL